MERGTRNEKMEKETNFDKDYLIKEKQWNKTA